jgi:uroporphyrinogen-III synthase
VFLVTRPQPKAQRSYQGLLEAGFDAFMLPAIEIEQLSVQLEKPTSPYDIVIVTSSFTELFLSNNIGALCGHHTRFLCVGQSSATTVEQCLDAINSKNEVLVAEPQNSEGLIASPLLQKNVSGKKVALVKGIDGRDLIAEYLEKNNAITNTYEVYKRIPALNKSRVNEVERLPIKCIIVTSVDIAQQIIEHFSFDWLEQRIFMVASPRIYDYVLSKGLQTPILSGSASHASIVECAQQLHLSGVLDDKR